MISASEAYATVLANSKVRGMLESISNHIYKAAMQGSTYCEIELMDTLDIVCVAETELTKLGYEAVIRPGRTDGSNLMTPHKLGVWWTTNGN